MSRPTKTQNIYLIISLSHRSTEQMLHSDKGTFQKRPKSGPCGTIPQMGEMRWQDGSCMPGEEDSLLRSEYVTLPLETFLLVDKEISYLM